MKTRTHPFFRWSGLIVEAVGMAGCASPGPPRAPSLHLPETVDTLHAERHGPDVVLRFVVPVKSTDGFALTTPVTGSLCRATGDGPCVVTGRRTVAGRVEWVDTLPFDLTTGPARKLTYRVELFNTVGKSAGPSDAVAAVAGAAPHAVDGLQVQGSREGVTLRWQAEQAASGAVLLERTSLGGGPPVSKPAGKVVLPAKGLPGKKTKVAGPAPNANGQEAGTVWLRAEPESAGAEMKDAGGTVDTSALADTSYRYTAERSRVVVIDGTKLEMRSAASAPVTFTLRDVYPPAVPQGLAAAGFPVEGSSAVAVDLIWQPNTEADLAGYNVYRQTLSAEGAPLGDAVKLNTTVVQLPAFHDTTAARGMRYKYTVTAVDAKGNASAVSAAAELTAAP